MVFDLSITDPLERVKAFFALVTGSIDSTWDTDLLSNVTPVSAQLTGSSTCTVLYLSTVMPHMCNRLGNLHGGCAATLFDLLTSASLAPVATEGKFAFAGVSRTLSCTYLRPVPEGSKMIVRCEVVAVGARLAAMRGEIRRAVRVRGAGGDEEAAGWEETGPVMVTCEHGKVNTDPKL